MNTSRITRIVLILIMTVFGMSMAFAGPEDVSAAAKTPAKPTITSCKVKNNTVTLKWKKAKNAKAYRVYVQTGASKWKYWKKVKKTAKNKKKYSDKLKYKLKISGKKYKVYKQANPYKIAKKKTTKRSFTFKGKYNKTYRFAVKSIRGKKLSAASKIKKVTTPKKTVTPTDPEDPVNPDDPENPVNPEDPEDPVNPDDPEQPVEPEKTEFTITYFLDGGENNPANPTMYKLGDSFTLLEPTKENYDFLGWYTDTSYKRQISVISPTFKQDLKLYAKWKLQALDINDEGMEDMIWSWWYYPQVVTDGDKTFWGFATKEGYCGIAMYDENTGATTKNLLKKATTVDDHNGMALTLLDDKRIMCTYAGGHNSDYEIHIRISDKPLDITSFSEDIVLESVGKTCYGQIIRSNGLYYLFYRVNNHSWAYRTSKDGINWNDEVIMIKTELQYYCKCMPTTDGDLIRILMYSNPTADAPEIRMGFLNTADDNYIYDADATSRLGKSRLDYQLFQVIQNVEPGKTQRLFDAAITAPDKPRFLYTAFTPTKGANDCVYYLHDSGKSYEICKGGNPIWDPKYQCGAAFIGNDKIALARNENAIDYVEMHQFDGAKVSLVKEVYHQFVKDSSRAARPIVDVNGKAFLWHVGYYDKNSYKNFSTNSMLYLIDKDKVIGEAGGPSEPDQTEFTITYELNGGENNAANPTQYTFGDTIPLEEPTKEGYIFKGWFLDKALKEGITSITPSTYGDLTLYAKWYLKETTIEDADLSDMIWGWWTYPQAVTDGNKVFWTYTTKEGYCGVACYDKELKTVTKKILKKAISVGDTNGVAITLMDNKKIMCTYSAGESATKEIHVRISDNPLDISSFETDITLTAANSASYSQLIKSNGKYYVFYRTNPSGSWAYRTSEDGVNWEKAVILLRETSLQYYCRFMPTTDDNLIRIIMCSNPDTTAPEIRMGFLNTTDNTVYDADGATQLASTNAPYTSFQILQNVEEGKTQRLLDVAVTAPSKPQFIFASFTLEKGLNDSVYYLYDSGKTLKICDGGKGLLDPKFQSGASFVGSGQIAAARNQDGNDYIEVYGYDGTQLTLQKTLFTQDTAGGIRAARPIADPSGNIILWHLGKYNSATSFNTSGVMYLIDQDKIIRDVGDEESTN